MVVLRGGLLKSLKRIGAQAQMSSCAYGVVYYSIDLTVWFIVVEN